MADQLIKNLRMAISATEESGFNVRSISNYHKFVTTSRAFYIPTAEKFDDRGRVGLGTDLPNVRTTGYLNPVSMEISSMLDTFIHPILMRRGSGTTATTASTVVAADLGSHIHSFSLAKTVTQLGSSTMVWGLGGADYAFPGMTVNSWRVEQSRSDIPTFTAGLVGTGKREAVGNPTLNTYVVPNEMNGAETAIYYTRNGSRVDLASRADSIQRVTGWDVGLAINNRTDDRRPGDLRVDATNPKLGHYVNRMTTGEREITGGITLVLGSTEMQEIADSLGDQILTDFTFECNGVKLIPKTGGGFTSIRYGIKFIFPKCYINMEEGVDDGGLAVVRGTLFPVYDSASDTALTVVVNNDTETLI